MLLKARADEMAQTGPSKSTRGKKFSAAQRAGDLFRKRIEQGHWTLQALLSHTKIILIYCYSF